MIAKEKIERLCECIIKGDKITNLKLLEIGFSESEIASEYPTIDLYNELQLYGKKLLSLKQYDRANKCFEVSCKVENANVSTYLNLFIKSIKKKDYSSAIKYFSVFNSIKGNEQDNNLILFLLGNIIKLPEELQERAKNIKLNDIIIDGKGKHAEIQNEIRFLVFQQKFLAASNKMNRLFVQKNSKLKIKALTLLLSQAAEAQLNAFKLIFEYINNDDYDSLKKYLLAKSLQVRLSLSENYTLMLIKELNKIQETNKVPEIIERNSSTIFEAIKNHDYEEALFYASEQGVNNNLLYAVLKKLNIEIAKLQSNGSAFKELPIYITEKVEETDPIILLNQIVDYLLMQDIEKACSSINQYLFVIGKSDYLTLIMDFIEISLITGDLTFSKPINILKRLSDQTKFNAALYIDSFLDTFEEKHYVQVTLEEFSSNPEEYYYELEKIETIAKLVAGSGVSINDACNMFGLEEEAKAIIPLIFARDSYANGKMDLGDYYYKLAEKHKPKTQKSKKMMEEIRKNRLFYKNRTSKKYKPLSLS